MIEKSRTRGTKRSGKRGEHLGGREPEQAGEDDDETSSVFWPRQAEIYQRQTVVASGADSTLHAKTVSRTGTGIMARNKKSAAGEGSEGGGGGGGRSESRGGGGGGVESGGSVGSGSRPSTSALIICRNK